MSTPNGFGAITDRTDPKEDMTGRINHLEQECTRLAVEKNTAKEEAGHLRASLAEQNVALNKARAESRKAQESVRKLKEVLAKALVDF